MPLVDGVPDPPSAGVIVAELVLSLEDLAPVGDLLNEDGELKDTLIELGESPGIRLDQKTNALE